MKKSQTDGKAGFLHLLQFDDYEPVESCTPDTLSPSQNGTGKITKMVKNQILIL